MTSAIGHIGHSTSRSRVSTAICGWTDGDSLWCSSTYNLVLNGRHTYTW